LFDYTAGKPDYFELLHKPESYHHRLDPGYLTNYHSFNSYYPYVHRGENMRLDYPETFEHPMGKRPREKNIRNDPVYAEWLKVVRAGLFGGDSFNKTGPEIADQLYRNPGVFDRYFDQQERRNPRPEERILNTPPLYLTPSRLYDNPDYRDIQRKSILISSRYRLCTEERNDSCVC
jgi:hypothetical protein